ncbi:transglycosylase domain-containing protein [Pseudactinotalea sp. Z1748]|uniref:transglycosylase domain-containing protein n=1 Tax=Pseudactinotalea sp. Z1748 TaxID=3413027 RepID=UPI003C7BE43B
MGAFLTLMALGVGVFVAAYLTIDIPEPEEFAMSESSTVFYADGETPMGSFAEVDRQIIDPDTLPEHVGQAVVASEDRRFYSNVGVDPMGILRALWNNLRGNPTQGGSTITQQYVERYYVGQTTSYAGKFQEAILALKIDREQSKDEILGNYLNTIYFGRGAYGIERAAQEYFDKPAEELTLEESAVLAGIIPAPSLWDPDVNPDQAQGRFDRTLRYMADTGFITQEEADAAEYPEVAEPVRTNVYAGPNGHLLAMVRLELVAAEFTEAEIDGGGMQITTTIDQTMQDAAVESAQDLPEDAPEELRVALSSVDNETGAILALYGGRDYLEVQRNAATQDTAQGGSTFKVFTLLAALENDITLEQRYPSYSPMEIDGYDAPVRNFDSPRNRGNIDLVHATYDSVNTYYVQLNQEVGPEHTVDMAHRLGLPEDTAGLEPVISNVLGSASPRNIDMARAFATIASGGERHQNYLVAEATGPQGNVIYTGESSAEQVVDPQVTADATYAMSQVVERGTGSTANQLGRPAAGKTGSSNDYRSAWFVGFVPQITTAVSMYQVGEDGSEEAMGGWGGQNVISGGSFPTQIWTDFMTVAVADLDVEQFPERSQPVAPPAPQPTRQPTQEETEEPEEEETEEPEEEEPEEPEEEETEESEEEPEESEESEEEETEESEEETDESTDDPGNGNGNGGDGNGGSGGGNGGGDGDGGGDADGDTDAEGLSVPPLFGRDND